MKIQRILAVLLLVSLAFSCAKEVVEPGQMISGDYALDDGSGLSDRYLSFKGGKMIEYRFSKTNLPTFAENTFWNCCNTDFNTYRTDNYYILGGVLYVNDKQYGRIELKEGVLTLDDKKYSELKSFQNQYYSSISTSDNTVVVPFEPSENKVPVTVTNPISAGVLSATSSADWIGDVRIKDGTLLFTASETKSERSGVIIMEYTNAKKYTLKIDQQAATFIVLPSEKGTVNYKAQSCTFDYSIQNPLPSSSLSVKCYANWVSDIEVTASAIRFNVSENIGIGHRVAVFTLSYVGTSDVTYTLTQKSTTTGIELSETSKDLTYTGGSVSVGYTIENPHEATSLTASTQQDWINDLKVSADKITFTVSENNSGSSRSGKITLKYGSFATKGFTVEQTGIPAQSISLSVASLDLTVDGKYTLTAMVVPSDAPVSWSSSDNNIVSVDNSGKVTAVGGGSATVTASSGDKSAVCTVSVSRLTPNFSISASTLSCRIGLNKTIVISSNSDCVFTAFSSNSAVADVSVSGKNVSVSGKSVGQATITVNCPQTSRYSAASSEYCNVNVAEEVDLSFNGTANCYIVNSTGKYKFKATVKGGSTESVGTPSSAETLWESFGTNVTPNVGDIVSNVVYSDGYAYFSTPETLNNGNAVIAVKDASGTILWSWHIWVCKDFDATATAQVYNNGAGTMMDRNLGATSATKGDVHALGLLYQWGRKDPFLSGKAISSDTQASSTLSWPGTVVSNSDNGTIAYAVAHPTTFIYHNYGNYDWYYTGSSSTDDTRWQSTKTIYDPCPKGWRIPDGGSSGVWSKAFGTSSKWTTSSNWDSTNKGMNFGATDKKLASGTVWYPAAGYRGRSDGSPYNVGYYGLYWSCTPSGNFAYDLCFYSNGSVSPSGLCDIRAWGHSVRCLSESK